VAFLEVSSSEAVRLKSMPDIVTHFKFGSLDGTYVLPPILYPDGKFYLKVSLTKLVPQPAERR
jgi:sarcosine oxidase